MLTEAQRAAVISAAVQAERCNCLLCVKRAAAIRAALDTIDKLTEALADMVAQHCRCADGRLDSMAESGPADAMRTLAIMGKLKITAEHGRRVIGEWIKEAAK
jgi:hypothetical protein